MVKHCHRRLCLGMGTANGSICPFLAARQLCGENGSLGEWVGGSFISVLEVRWVCFKACDCKRGV